MILLVLLGLVARLDAARADAGELALDDDVRLGAAEIDDGEADREDAEAEDAAEELEDDAAEIERGSRTGDDEASDRALLAELIPADALMPDVALADDAADGRAAGAPVVVLDGPQLPEPRPSRWGRLEVGLAWRYRSSEPRFAPRSYDDAVWLLATWRP